MFQTHIQLPRKYLRSGHALPRDYEVTAGFTLSDMLTLHNQKPEYNSHDISPDVQRSLNIQTTRCSSSDLGAKCQQVINNKLTVHYQLIDCLQQINGLRLRLLHLKAHLTERKTKRNALLVILTRSYWLYLKPAKPRWDCSSTHAHFQFYLEAAWLQLYASSNKTHSE